MAWRQLLGSTKSADELRRSARLKRVEAKMLEKEAGKLQSQQRALGGQAEEEGANKPYACAASGEVRLPMWCSESLGEFAFGLRWKVRRKNGDVRYRRSISVDLFEDVICGLSELAGMYAEEKRLPSDMQRRMREYQCVLRVVPDSVRAGLAEGQGSRANGGNPPNAK